MYFLFQFINYKVLLIMFQKISILLNFSISRPSSAKTKFGLDARKFTFLRAEKNPGPAEY
jgi:hypothetical protein